MLIMYRSVILKHEIASEQHQHDNKRALKSKMGNRYFEHKEKVHGF